ncbi:MAG: hypothetical protein AB1744_12925, partial [Candidatus Zixiibacteriota bacterium]
LFVVGDVSTTAPPDATFRAQIPVNGCQYASANDGPHDAPLPGAATFTISNSGLRVSHSPLEETYSVGQTIAVRITVTNLLATAMDTVLGQIVNVDNPAIVTLDSSVSGPVPLDASASTDFVFYYTAGQPGDVSWQLRALAPTIPDSSAVVQTGSARVQASPSDVVVRLINTIPASVTRGQTNVFPLSIRFAHPDTLPTFASLRLDSLRLRVEDGAGADQAAGDVFSRMVLATNYANLAVLEVVPSQSSVLLQFSEPVVVTPGQEQRLTLAVDIDSLATASDFALATEEAGAIVFVDDNTLQPVSIDPAVTFPLKTASCRINDPAKQMAVSNISPSGGTVNFGQQNVELLQLGLRHPGTSGSSQIQLTGLSLVCVDDSGDTVNAADLLDEVRLLRQQNILGWVSGIELDTARLEIQLSSPLTLNYGQTDSLKVSVSVREQTTHSGFNLVVSDSTLLEVRDLSSGSLLDAATDTLALATGSVFPIVSGQALLKQPASPAEACLTSLLPASVIGGVDSLPLMEFSVS